MSEIDRNAGLRQMLRGYRSEVQADVRSRFRGGLADVPTDVQDDMERCDARMHGEIEVALLQARAEIVARIDEALRRLDEGKYGSCRDCAAGIAERRLRALPFAVRCQACEERREADQRRAERAERRDRISLFADSPGA
jgi:RNA polymerase-binding transcription factor